MCLPTAACCQSKMCCQIHRATMCRLETQPDSGAGVGGDMCGSHGANCFLLDNNRGGGAAMDDLQDAPATFHMEGFYLNATCSVCTGGCFSCSACEPLCDVFSGLRGFTQQHFLTVSGCACWVYDVCASRWKIFQTCIMGEAQWNISGNGNL